MSVGWSGVDPTGFTDTGLDYELGNRFLANADITITKVRVWGGASSVAKSNRAGRIWSSGGVLLSSATLPGQLLSGWNEYDLSPAVPVPSGTSIWVSHSVQDTYGAVTGGSVGFPRASADGLVTANLGAINDSPGAFPNNPFQTFYSVDIVYAAGLGGNARPVVGITAASTATPLQASATLTVDDESPSTCSFSIEWGDGTSSTVSTLGPHLHTYAAAGTYVVLVTVTDNGGLTDSAATMVTVAAAPGALHPTSELVAVGWLKAIGLTSGAVATTLPAPSSTGVISWASTGFVQVAGVGGTTGTDYRLRMPAVGVTCWAVNQGSSKPPWGKANQLAEVIIAAAEAGSNWRLTNLPAAYAHAHVQNVRCSEPRRLPDDGGGYARYTFDLYMDWVEV